MKKNIGKKIIILIAIIFPLFFGNGIAQAASPQELQGANFLPFTKDCTGTQAFEKNHGIVYPKGVNKIDQIYIYFHGQKTTPGEVNMLDQAKNKKFGESVAALQASHGLSVAILLPQLNNNSGNNVTNFTKERINCFVAEAIRQLKLQVPNSPDSISVVMGHSAGGGAVAGYINSGLTANTTIVFDGCYGDWCKTYIAPKASSGNVYYYFQQNDKGFEKSRNQSTNASTASPAKSKLFEVSTNHEGIPTYCLFNHILNNNCGPGKAKQISGAVAGETVIPVTKLAEDIVSKIPSLSIKIPNLKFSELTAVVKDEAGRAYIYIPWIGQYLSAVYKFAMVIASILAVIVIILSGARMIVSAGGEEKNAAIKRLTQAIIGLFLCWGSYAILYNINPDLVNFTSLKVPYVVGQSLGGEEESVEANTALGSADPGLLGTPADTKINKPTDGLCFPVKRSEYGEIAGNAGGNLGGFRGPTKGAVKNGVQLRAPTFRCHAGLDIYNKVVAEKKIPTMIYNMEKGVITSVIGMSECTPGIPGVGIYVYYDAPLDMTVGYDEINTKTALYNKTNVGQTIEKGVPLGIASGCNMLHMEFYEGRFAPKSGAEIFWAIPEAEANWLPNFSKWIADTSGAPEKPGADWTGAYQKANSAGVVKFVEACRSIGYRNKLPNKNLKDGHDFMVNVFKNPIVSPPCP